MNWVASLLPETITYWAPGGTDQYGQTQFAAPVEISAKWERESEEFVDENGETKVSEAVVFVDREVATGGYLYRGISGASDPSGVNNAYRIAGYSEVSGLDNSGAVERHALL